MLKKQVEEMGVRIRFRRAVRLHGQHWLYSVRQTRDLVRSSVWCIRAGRPLGRPR